MIASRLSTILGERKMTMTALAEASGVNRNTISRWYYDEAKMIDLKVLKKVCDALRCQPGDIFVYTKHKK